MRGREEKERQNYDEDGVTVGSGSYGYRQSGPAKHEHIFFGGDKQVSFPARFHHYFSPTTTRAFDYALTVS